MEKRRNQYNRFMPTREEIIVQNVTPLLQPGQQILEIGAGNGLVAEMLYRSTGACFTLLDVVNYNKSSLPMMVYDGRVIPFADNSFDLAMLVFVLHHNPDPVPVLHEALRVSRQGVLIVENDVRGTVKRPATRMVDSLEHLRRGVPPCYFTKSVHEWLRLLDELAPGSQLVSQFKIGWFWHNAILSLPKASSPTV